MVYFCFYQEMPVLATIAIIMLIVCPQAMVLPAAVDRAMLVLEESVKVSECRIYHRTILSLE